MLNFDRLDITSRQNPKLQRLVELLRQPSARREQGLFVFEGPHVLAESIAAHAPIDSLFVSPKFQDRPDAKNLLPALKKFRIFTISDGLLGSALEMDRHQGIAGLCTLPPEELPAPHGIGLLLAGLQDPGNLGALVRACDAFAAGPIFCLSGGADPYGPKAVRASAGSLFRLWPRVVTAGQLEDWLSRHGAELHGLDAHGGAELGVAKLKPPCLLAVGQEGGGLPKSLEPLLAKKLHLALPGQAESLNAAQAGTLALYLATRKA